MASRHTEDFVGIDDDRLRTEIGHQLYRAGTGGLPVRLYIPRPRATDARHDARPAQGRCEEKVALGQAPLLHHDGRAVGHHLSGTLHDHGGLKLQANNGVGTQFFSLIGHAVDRLFTAFGK